ncbi:MAG: hypothetical protein JRH01_08135 [Deltaproteobacteria bacterium]|nr:hypothetical protein [Deltaproteobacteria bacterium]MBW2393794.1 hypothetical protein [Deltaproteobacteria bacterium]
MPVTHGGNRRTAARAWGCEPADILDLSTGVPPEPELERLAGRLAKLAPTVSSYPDPAGEPARSCLAKTLRVAPECLVVASGAQALVEVIFQAFGWKSLALREPGYAEVRRCAERSGVHVRGCAMTGDWPEADARWVIDPHGFTGQRTSNRGEAPGVLDESYAPFDQRTGGVLPGWIRIGSLTKCFSIPGLRLGYAVASLAEIETLCEWLPPWPASSLALHLLPELLPDWTLRDEQSARGRKQLEELLARQGWEIWPGEASFVLARPRGKLPDFASHRILVRTFEEWPELRGWMRFGIPPRHDWTRLEAALCL